MKKVSALFLMFLFLSFSVWAEDNSNRKNSVYTLEKGLLADTSVAFVVEDVAISISIVYDPAVDSLFAVVPPIFGTLRNNPVGFSYLPNTNFYQVYSCSPIDSFLYALKFTDGTYDSAWVYVDSIAGVNDVPLAIRDTFEVMQDSGVIYAPVLENDIDRDRVGLQVSILSPANNGTVTFFETVYETPEGAHVFFPNAGTPYNDNLDLCFDKRDITYMLDTVFVYEPDSGIYNYGYDSISYIINEYRIPSLLPFPSVEDEYRYANVADADTATVVFYVIAHNYLPVAVNDTVKLLGGEYMKESVYRQSRFFYPTDNDLDFLSEPAPGMENSYLEIPYILENRSDTLTASADDSTVVFYHSIAYYDIDSQRIMYREDSNVVSLNIVSGISYDYAAGYSGVDSVFYVVVEKPLLGNDYPSEYRGDTSEMGLIYFVVEPANDVSIPFPDTLDFNRSQLRTKMSFGDVQYFDVLSNDLDVDDTDSATFAKMKSLMGNDYKSEFETYGKPSFKTKTGLLETVVSATPGDVRLINDSVFYQYRPLYGRELLIDSFKYLVYNGDVIDTSAWAYIRHRAVVAQDDIVSVNMSTLVMSDSSIASNLLLTGNDLAQGALSILYNADGTLNSPSQSSYAEIRKPESGEVNYIYHQGFTLKDSFQYIVTDLITNDTAWVFINNAPCVAEDDIVGLQQDPFASSSYYEVIDVLANDNDPEDIKDIVPFETDTLDTSNGRVVIQKTDAGVWLNYYYKRNFFYKDSFVYIMTDVPAIYAASNFFTQDGAWVYIEDTAYVIDSDGDGIVNTMEDSKIGYQLYEDTLDFDMDGIPNYLDNDANGFPAAGDCDGDGIFNSLDADPGCDDIIVSTAFTPNGDNINDFFVIPEIIFNDNSVMQASIKIYNRLGVLVYENNNYGQNGDWWDGKLGNVQGVAVGDELPNGVYLYYLIYNDGLSQKESYIHIQR